MMQVKLNQRRASVLLMVVSLLALLFVIITGFLNLARSGRNVLVQKRTGAEAARANEAVINLVLGRIGFPVGANLDHTKPNIPLGGNSDDFMYEDIPGYRTSYWLASAFPVWDSSRPPGMLAPRPSAPGMPGYNLGSQGNFVDLWRLRYPALTALTPPTDTRVADPRAQRAKPIAPAIVDVIPEDPADNDAIIQANGAGGALGNGYEFSRAAISGAMDATGTGIPDSHLLAVGQANEIANQIAGVNIDLPNYDFELAWLSGFAQNPAGAPDSSNFNPAFLAATAGLGPALRQFNNDARYVVAARVIGHGGMVALDSPPLRNSNGSTDLTHLPWNRMFLADLFNYVVRSPNDSNVLNPLDLSDTSLFTTLKRDAVGVESTLRRRGGLLASYRQYNANNLGSWQTMPREPAALQVLEQTFPWTMLPNFGGTTGTAFAQKKDNWQRFNLGFNNGTNNNDRAAFGSSAAIDPYIYSNNTRLAKAAFAARTVVSVTNNSDEIARKQDPTERTYMPNPNLNNVPTDESYVMLNPGTYSGESKFWLGQIADAFYSPSQGLWVLDSRPITGSQVVTGIPKSRSDIVIERLASYYYDMLGGHSQLPNQNTGVPNTAGGMDWNSKGGLNSPTEDPSHEAVTRLEQAFSLAVNTVAFAAPRCTNALALGTIDGVVYPSNPGTLASGVRYIGYAPQPVISEVICYNSEPNTATQDVLSLAVELYNPNDPYYASSDPNSDVFGLYLPHFAIGIVDPNNLSVISPTPINSTVQHMAGRSFRTFVIADPMSSWPGTTPGLIEPLAQLNSSTSAAKQFQVILYRAKINPLNSAAVTEWLPIDEVMVEVPRYLDGNLPAYGVTNRDTHAAPYLGVVTPPLATTAVPARWSAMMNVFSPPTWGVSNGVTGSGTPPTGSLSNPKWIDTATNLVMTPEPDPLDPTAVVQPKPSAPITPFPVMSAGPWGNSNTSDLNTLGLYLNGIYRPRSFPTVGFLAFVPRFAHAQINGGKVVPMADILQMQWHNRGYNGVFLTQMATTSTTPTTYPLDFGHMPFFDNNQAVFGAPLPATNLQKVGAVPWGQLIFDYFTVLNPTLDLNGDGQPDFDPLKVPGRININEAPWQMLAGLPVYRPDGLIKYANGSTRVAFRFTTAGVPTLQDPSPSFWSPAVGMLAGAFNWTPQQTVGVPQAINGYRFVFAGNITRTPASLPIQDSTGTWRLGPWLAWSAAGYRDGIPYAPAPGTPQGNNGAYLYYDSYLRNYTIPVGGANRSPGVFVGYRPPSAPLSGVSNFYGNNGAPANPNSITSAALNAPVRGQPFYAAGSLPTGPSEFGFISIGELLNAKGWDSSLGQYGELQDPNTSVVAEGDYLRAVSLLVELDTALLTTRSNTFTAYVSLIDRQTPQNSTHSEIVLDRSNMLPRLTLTSTTKLLQSAPLRITIGHQTAAGASQPEIISKREVGYFNSQFDD